MTIQYPGRKTNQELHAPFTRSTSQRDLSWNVISENTVRCQGLDLHYTQRKRINLQTADPEEADNGKDLTI